MSRLLFTTGFLAVMVGILIMIIAMIWLMLSARVGRVRGGGVALIGPFPIVFGTDRELIKLAFALAVVLLLLALAIMIVPFVLMRW